MRLKIKPWAPIAVCLIGLLAVLAACAAPHPPPCRPMTFEGDVFTVCEANLQESEFRLVYDDATGAALRSYAGLERYLGADARRVQFAMNAGMFNEEGAPIGLYIENGQERRSISTRRGPGNFHMLPNGVFSIDLDGQARVETTAAFLARRSSSVWATQSGPMLLIGGRLHPSFQNDGPSRVIRNGVGARDGQTLVFVISETPVSFGKFARFFRDELGCENALFLDGSVSSLWVPSLDRRDSGFPLGPMAVILEPEAN